MSWVFIATTAFLSEAAPRQAAGAFALGNMLRNPGAAIAALVLPLLVARMGVGWFFSGLGILDLVVVGGAVMGEHRGLLWAKTPADWVKVLRIRGPVWRARSTGKPAP